MLQGVVPSKFKIDARSHFGRVPSALLLELWAFSQLTTEVKQWHYQSSYPKNSDWEGSLAYGLAYCLAQDEIWQAQTTVGAWLEDDERTVSSLDMM